MYGGRLRNKKEDSRLFPVGTDGSFAVLEGVSVRFA